MADSNVNYYKPGGKRTSEWPKYPVDTVETYWEDVRIPGSQIQQSGERPPDLIRFRNKTGAPSTYGVYAYSFDKTEVEDLHFAIQIPHAWKEGTRIYPHLHWSPSDTASSGSVVWGLEYVSANVWEPFPSATNFVLATSSAINPQTEEVADRDHLIASFHYDADNGIYGIPVKASDLSQEYRDANPGYYDVGDDKLISHMMMCRIVRYATHLDDDYDADAFFLEFDVHFEVNSPGSIRPMQKIGDRSRTGRFRL